MPTKQGVLLRSTTPLPSKQGFSGFAYQVSMLTSKHDW